MQPTRIIAASVLSYLVASVPFLIWGSRNRYPKIGVVIIREGTWKKFKLARVPDVACNDLNFPSHSSFQIFISFSFYQRDGCFFWGTCTALWSHCLLAIYDAWSRQLLRVMAASFMRYVLSFPSFIFRFSIPLPDFDLAFKCLFIFSLCKKVAFPLYLLIVKIIKMLSKYNVLVWMKVWTKIPVKYKK